MRYAGALLLLVLTGTIGLQAGEDPLSGYWRVNLYEDDQQLTYWLLKLDNKGGKLTAAITPLKRIPPTTIDNLQFKSDILQFHIRLGNGAAFIFEGKVPKTGAKRIFGCVTRGNSMIPAILEGTSATNAFELNREMVQRSPNDPRVFDAVLDLIREAKENKAAPQDVQDWVDTALRVAENYGPRWYADTSLRMVETLLAEGMPNLTVATARKVEKSFDAKGAVDPLLRLYGTVASALRSLKQVAQAQEFEAKIDKLEIGAYQEYSKTSPPYKLSPFAGRKGKSDRAVLVELFTGAQCPPCVAADLGFDGLEKTYSPSEVVLLQYHLHVPGPDALTNPDTESRGSYYEKFVEGTPTILFNGKPAAPGGGGSDDAPDKYKEYREVIDPLLEKTAPVSLQVQAARKGDAVDIKATVRELDKPGDKIKLRLALVEDWVRYRGRNGLSFHHRVVRAMPGGATGIALTKKDADYAASVDLADLRKKLDKYLDDFAMTAPFLDSQRPMQFRNLHVVAFVQSDETREVLQAVDVKIKE